MASAKLHEALELWRGPALDDFTYEPFAQSAIVRLEELRLVALERRIEADLELGRDASSCRSSKASWPSIRCVSACGAS